MTGNVDFIAYYPFHSSVGSNFTIPVSVADQATGLPTEVLFSNNIANQAPTTNAVTLNFHYSLAKLALTVTSESDTRSAMDFENMTVRIEGMYTQADLQLAGGTFVNHRARQPKVLHRTDSSATAASFEGLALPSEKVTVRMFTQSVATLINGIFNCSRVLARRLFFKNLYNPVVLKNPVVL